MSGNTVGSRSKTDLAYVAGFLDGDGSLMLQIKKRSDGKLQRRFMCTVCLYQDSRHEETLRWMQQLFHIGYVSRRNDGMSELRINGYRQVRDVLSLLLPFIRLKKNQAQALFKASTLLSEKGRKTVTDHDLRILVDCIVMIQEHNYATRKKRTRNELLLVLGLTP